MPLALRKGRRLGSFVGLLLILSVVLMMSWSRADAVGPTVTVQTSVVDAGQTVSIPIILSEAPSGFSGYDVTVTLSNSVVVDIVGADIPDFGLVQKNLVSTSEIRLSAVDLNGLISTGATNILLASVTILGIDEGQTTVNIQVTAMDDGGGYPINPQALSGTVDVINVVPVVDSGPAATIVKGGTFSNSGSFTDTNSDTWTATVDYGDGSGVQPLALTGNTFALSHVYSQVGNYTVTVVVTDDSAAAGSATVQVSVTFVTLSGMTAPAQDLDGDGKAEDINGNGRLDFADLVVLFQQKDSPEVQNNQSDFDFNGNGFVDLDDIVTLFGALAA